MYFFVNVM